jgi:hypothetical protein
MGPTDKSQKRNKLIQVWQNVLEQNWWAMWQIDKYDMCNIWLTSNFGDSLQFLTYSLEESCLKFILSIIHSKFQEMLRYENSNSRKVSEKYHN